MKGSQQLSSPLNGLSYAEPTLLYLRDGEVVIYRRGDSPLWQCRYKLANGSWHRVSTKRASIEAAVAVATDLYRRTLYSLRHTYATRELLAGRASIHDLENQMGTSISMIQKHYSKASVHLVAERLAESGGKN